MHVCEGVSEGQFVLLVLLLSKSLLSAVSQLLQAGPGAVGSGVGAVGRAHSAALCWAGKAVLES